jgi:hypothetical protein
MINKREREREREKKAMEGSERNYIVKRGQK